MDSGLQIGVEKYLFGKDVPSNGIIANIYALDPDKHANSKRDVVIPIGFSGLLQRVDLEPGNYLVEAILPSGNILTQEAEVIDGEWPKVLLEAEDSAHEWHSWQNLLGNVQSKSGYEASTKDDDIPNYDVVLIKTSSFNPRGAPRKASSEWQRWRSWRWPYRYPFLFSTRTAWDRVEASDDDGGSQLHSFVMDYKGDLTRRVPRWWVLVSTDKAARLLTAPTPWFSFDPQHLDQDRAELASELLITKSPDRSIQSSWVIPDLKLGTLLGYLARGAFKDAFKVGSRDSALQMLFGKYENPLGAAAGGYVLIGNMNEDPEEVYWHPWIENLRRDFEWLPDGAIQSAWLRLKQGSLEANRGQVKKDLFQAFDRGIPYYSLGLQWLADGLTLLAVDDEEAANRLKMVQRVSFSADVSSLFTALNLRPY